MQAATLQAEMMRQQQQRLRRTQQKRDLKSTYRRVVLLIVPMQECAPVCVHLQAHAAQQPVELEA